jgi:hypothetical protein
MNKPRKSLSRVQIFVRTAILVFAITATVGIIDLFARHPGGSRALADGRSASSSGRLTIANGTTGAFRQRIEFESSGFTPLLSSIEPWSPDAPLREIAEIWTHAGKRAIAKVDAQLPAARDAGATVKVVDLLILRAMLLNSEGEAKRAYETLEEARSLLTTNEFVSLQRLYTITYFQGVTAMRRGETENCIDCRGESSCILPIAPAAVHTIPTGSRLAIQHFTDYLRQFPKDLEVRWLLNLAHMTLGEYPAKVEPMYLVPLDRFTRTEFDIGKFREVGHLLGVNRLNPAGGTIMDDFDNDGLLDLIVTSFHPSVAMAYYRNAGNGTFDDRSKEAGLTEQLGGLVCYQTDYNNDGRLDVFVPRGAWMPYAIRPSLLRNDGGGKFTDVTDQAGVRTPVNSNAACWADYDNDGWLDVFVGCEAQPHLLYHNRGDGTFEEVAARAGLRQHPKPQFCKGTSWVDFDNDDYPDLFLNNLESAAELYRNNRDGTFTNVTSELGINGPYRGFSCWAFDYDNDGWLDIFATSYDRSLDGVVRGLLGMPHVHYTSRLFRNLGGNGFDDKTKEAGLDLVYASMGTNYADFDNDGFLDMYLGTGDPSLATLVPNRMLKNVGGTRFSEITGSTGTGHLQKGHGVACGDWDRDGDNDVFIQTGGAIAGDQFHNLMFQNPGQGNHWLTVKLIGKKTNRAAVGARIKVVTAGEKPLTIHRHISSGSSFGANPLQQTIGLARSNRVALLEIHWPTTKTTQVFRDIPADQAIEITEFDDNYRALGWTPVSLRE